MRKVDGLYGQIIVLFIAITFYVVILENIFRYSYHVDATFVKITMVDTLYTNVCTKLYNEIQNEAIYYELNEKICILKSRNQILIYQSRSNSLNLKEWCVFISNKAIATINKVYQKKDSCTCARVWVYSCATGKFETE